MSYCSGKLFIKVAISLGVEEHLLKFLRGLQTLDFKILNYRNAHFHKKDILNKLNLLKRAS